MKFRMFLLSKIHWPLAAAADSGPVSVIMAASSIAIIFVAINKKDMLQLATLRNNPDAVKQRLAVKNFNELNLVDEIIALDDERKKYNFQYDDTKAKLNAASKEIGALMAKGQKEEADAKKKEVESLKASLKPIEESLAKAEKTLDEMLVRLIFLLKKYRKAKRLPIMK